MKIEKLYRKRLIPNECVPLKDDIILFQNDERIITRWNTLKPRTDFHHGYSCYFIKEGYKISRFYKEDGSLLYWYCDIITCDYNEKESALCVTDLLADVIVYPDDYMQVLDLDELCDAREQELITQEQFLLAIRRLNSLLTIIYDGGLSAYAGELLKYIP